MTQTTPKCECCGRFVLSGHFIPCANDDEEWLECIHCCSEEDANRFYRQQEVEIKMQERDEQRARDHYDRF